MKKNKVLITVVIMMSICGFSLEACDNYKEIKTEVKVDKDSNLSSETDTTVTRDSKID